MIARTAEKNTFYSTYLYLGMDYDFYPIMWKHWTIHIKYAHEKYVHKQYINEVKM